ncbi:hypothetical protein HPB47_015003 [Ixodes persulcatus]|uniref:Uncharacterized protein n=1 Tax=Ixodes persulcatus TaxID=34615 RepID=A0AC60QUL1_IXOPE|nr:hypothetical protein HPB47_015003 [Ixodes persulcatus]
MPSRTPRSCTTLKFTTATREVLLDQEETPSVEGPAETFACGDCDSVFASLEHLQRNRKSMHERRGGRHRCGHCPYSSDHKQHLVVHERTHTGQRPFVCDTCGKALTQQGKLTRHRRDTRASDRTSATYAGRRRTKARTPESGPMSAKTVGADSTPSGEKAYAFHLCCYRASNLSYVKRHVIRVHSKEYRHKCGDCGKGFLSPCLLRSHMRRQYVCDDKEQWMDSMMGGRGCTPNDTGETQKQK